MANCYNEIYKGQAWKSAGKSKVSYCLKFTFHEHSHRESWSAEMYRENEQNRPANIVKSKLSLGIKFPCKEGSFSFNIISALWISYLKTAREKKRKIENREIGKHMGDVTEPAPHMWANELWALPSPDLLLDRDGQCLSSPPCGWSPSHPASMGTAHPAWLLVPWGDSSARSVAAWNPVMMIFANQTEHTLVFRADIQDIICLSCFKALWHWLPSLTHSFPNFFFQHCLHWALGFLLQNLWKR